MTQHDPALPATGVTPQAPAYAPPPAYAPAPVVVPAPEAGYSAYEFAPPAAPVERVGRGLLFASAAIPVSAILTVVIWQLGFIASISSFLLAAGAVWLYQRGAGTTPRSGLVPVIGLVVVGIAVSFFAVVASDLVSYYNSPDADVVGMSQVEFVTSNLFYGPVLSTYVTDFLMFVVFAALGVFSTLRRLARGH